MRAIDLTAYGFDRQVDHEFWTQSAERATLWLRRGEPCAYSYRGGFTGLIGPVAGLDPESAAHALRAELTDSDGGEVRVDVPGTATALVEVALEAGLRFGARAFCRCGRLTSCRPRTLCTPIGCFSR